MTTLAPWSFEPRHINGQLQHFGILDSNGWAVGSAITEEYARLMAAAPELAERVKELERELARLRAAKEQGVTLRWQTIAAAVAENDGLRGALAAAALASRTGASASEPPKASPKLCETCQLRPAVCAIGKGGHIGSVQLCESCWREDWGDLSDDGREEDA